MKSSSMKSLAGFAAVAAMFVMASAVQAHPSRCSSCHVPHKAGVEGDGSAVSYGVPLWNPSWGGYGKTPQITVPTFTIYASATFNPLNTGINQPDGPSKLCLGCHDGGGTSNANHQFGDAKNLTLFQSHPISFVYDTALANNPKLHVAGGLKDPSAVGTGIYPNSTIAKDLLDSQGKLQCTSCHDIHSSNTTPNLAMAGTNWGGTTMRFTYTADLGLSMCRTCHNK